MKKFTLYILTAFGLMGLATSCNDFGDVNNDPMNLNPGVVDYKMEFTQVEAQICGSDWDVWRNGCIYTANMIQHTASVDWAYGVFYTWNDQYSGAYWGGFYSGGRAAIRNIIDVMNNWEGNPAYANEYQMCRILKAYMFQNMTDLYGDVPYSEAGQGYSTNPIPYPKYDTQEAIYNDLLKELDEAQAALSTSAGNTIGAADLIYNGDAAKWKKFANSLMLRVAMRLTKVAPDKAKTWVAKAVSNGLFVSNDDNAIVRHTNGSPSDDSAEPYGKVFSSLDTQAFYISETFINILQDDPRLPLIATVCTRDPKPGWGDADFDLGDNTAAKQKGMPVGYDVSGGDWDLSKAPGYPGENWRKAYSVPNRTVYARPDSPSMLVTHAGNLLLLADAVKRGLYTGYAEKFYRDGVTAAMKQFSYYEKASAMITDDAITAYLNANPLDADTEKALEQINTEYYIHTFCNEYEAFANWRRTGYPKLTPSQNAASYPNNVTNGEIPRRFIYPASEITANPVNYNDAVKRLSDGDKMTSRVWWDKK